MPKDVIAFVKKMESLPHKHKIVIAGNHGMFNLANDELWSIYTKKLYFSVCQTSRLMLSTIRAAVSVASIGRRAMMHK